MENRVQDRLNLYRKQREAIMLKAEKDIYAIDTVIAEYEMLLRPEEAVEEKVEVTGDAPVDGVDPADPKSPEQPALTAAAIDQADVEQEANGLPQPGEPLPPEVAEPQVVRSY